MSFTSPATNERLSDIHAALGWSQCQRLEQFKTRRAAIYQRYYEWSRTVPFISMAPPPEKQSPFWHLAACQIDFSLLNMTREELFLQAREQNIGLQVHYIPLHYQPILTDASCIPDGLPAASTAYQKLVSLPCYADLTEEEQTTVMNFFPHWHDLCVISIIRHILEPNDEFLNRH